MSATHARAAVRAMVCKCKLALLSARTNGYGGKIFKTPLFFFKGEGSPRYVLKC